MEYQLQWVAWGKGLLSQHEGESRKPPVVEWEPTGFVQIFTAFVFEKKRTLSEDDESPLSIYTLRGTNISPLKVAGKMIFLFPRWDILVPCRGKYIDPTSCVCLVESQD